jgi:hypothetical protein
MKINRYVLCLLIIGLSGMIYLPLRAQQKKGIQSANFSGEWKSKESISMGGNIVCSYESGDRMLSTTMKIVEQGDYLTIENPKADPSTPLVKSIEKLIFDGKTRQISHSQENIKKYAVKLSDDGHTMTIHSIVYFMNAKPYHIDVLEKAFTEVTEVWKLSKDGKSISVLSKAKSNIWDEERSWETVFDKIN